MTCEEIRFEIATAEAAAPSPDVGAHLAGCAGCRAYAARDAAVRNLLAFKRNETADAHFETRLAARVRGEIDGTLPGRAWIPAALREWFTPAVRWSAAAATLVVIGLGFLRPGVVPMPVPGLAVETPEPAPVSMYADGRAPAAVPTPAVPPMLATLTNQGPPMIRLNPGGAVEYGTGGTVPVNYQY